MAVRIAVAGAGGRMGQALIEATLSDPALKLGAAFDLPGSASAGRDGGERFGMATGVAVVKDGDAVLGRADVVVCLASAPPASHHSSRRSSQELRRPSPSSLPRT
jgi:4-hydroxy-tetrahydrodipicolinate reductase